MDVTSLSSVEAAFAAIQSEFNRPCDTLINNSGVAQSSWFMDTDEEEWKTVIDTNLSGAWRVAKHAAKAMIADQQPGSIGFRTRTLSNSRKLNFSRLFHDTD